MDMFLGQSEKVNEIASFSHCLYREAMQKIREKESQQLTQRTLSLNPRKFLHSAKKYLQL